MSFHMNFHHVYIKSFSSIVGKKKKKDLMVIILMKA